MPIKTKLRRKVKPENHLTRGHCQRMLSVFSDILDRKSKSRLCRRIEQHLNECPDCRMYVDTMKKTVVLYRSLGQEQVPDDVQDRLFATIRLKNETNVKKACSKNSKKAASERTEIKKSKKTTAAWRQRR